MKVVLKVQKISKGIIAIPVVIHGEDTPLKTGQPKLHCLSPPQASTKKCPPRWRGVSTCFSMSGGSEAFLGPASLQLLSWAIALLGLASIRRRNVRLRLREFIRIRYFPVPQSGSCPPVFLGKFWASAHIWRSRHTRPGSLWPTQRAIV